MQQTPITTNPLPPIELPGYGKARPQRTRQRQLPRHHPRRKAKPFGSSQKRQADWRLACLQAYLAKYLKIEQGQGHNTTRGIPGRPIPLRQQPA